MQKVRSADYYHTLVQYSGPPKKWNPEFSADILDVSFIQLTHHSERLKALRRSSSLSSRGFAFLAETRSHQFHHVRKRGPK